MQNLTFQLITDFNEAKEWWNKFAYGETIYSNWDFRNCFYTSWDRRKPSAEIRFYVGYFKDEPVGLMPLQYNQEEKYLEFFGGSYMEDNQIYIKPGYEKYLPEFYDQIKEKAKLEYIIGHDEFTKKLKFKDWKYVLPLTGMKSHLDYVEKYFHGETKKKLKKRLKKVPEENKIEVVFNNFADIELLFQYNIEKFKNDSSFVWPGRKEAFRELLKPPFHPYLMTFLVNGQKQAVSLGILHNGVYESFNTGVSADAVYNLSSYIHVKKIDHAIELGAKLFDAFTGDYGWKENWNFDKIPQYSFYHD